MTEHHHDDDHGFSHVMPSWMLLAVFGALIVLTVVTVLLAGQEALKGFDIIVALAIATVKAALVMLFFMHLIYDKPLNAVLFIFSFGFVALFLGFALTDTDAYQSRIKDFNQSQIQVETPEDENPALASASPGEKLFIQVCASCHQYDVEKQAPTLQEIYKLHQGKPEAIVQWAMEPKHKRKDKFPRPMPPMAYLGKRKLGQIADFMLQVGSGEVKLVIDDSNWIRKLDPAEITKRVMAAQGDPKAGEILFTNQTCVSCHAELKTGARPVGPLMKDVSKRLKKEEIVESILNPSAKIAKGFETVSIITLDGLVHTGMIMNPDDATARLELRLPDGKMITLDKDEDVDEIIAQKQSQMPTGVVDNITPEQLADLVAYLQSL